MDEGGRAQTVPEGLTEQQQQQLGRQNVVLNYGGIPHPAFERYGKTVIGCENFDSFT